MGAGSITSNVKSDKKLITIKGPDGNIDTGIKKIGAFLGDNVEIGCGSVLNPGTIIEGIVIYIRFQVSEVVLNRVQSIKIGQKWLKILRVYVIMSKV